MCQYYFVQMADILFVTMLTLMGLAEKGSTYILLSQGKIIFIACDDATLLYVQIKYRENRSFRCFSFVNLHFIILVMTDLLSEKMTLWDMTTFIWHRQLKIIFNNI